MVAECVQTKQRAESKVAFEILAVRIKRADVKTASRWNKRNPTNINALKLKKAQNELANIYLKEQTKYIQNQTSKIRELPRYNPNIHSVQDLQFSTTQQHGNRNCEDTEEESKWLSEESIPDITSFDYPSNSKSCMCKKNLEATILFVDFSQVFDSIHIGKKKQILHAYAYAFPKETVAAIMMLYTNTKVKVRSPNWDTDYVDIVAGVLQGDTLAPYLFIICRDNPLRTSINFMKGNNFKLAK